MFPYALTRGFHNVGILLISFLFLAIAPAVMAQTDSTGVPTGRITDPSGSVVLNVTVTGTTEDTAQP